MDDVTDLPARALGTPIRRPVHFVNSVQTIIPARPEASALPFPRGNARTQYFPVGSCGFVHKQWAAMDSHAGHAFVQVRNGFSVTLLEVGAVAKPTKLPLISAIAKRAI